MIAIIFWTLFTVLNVVSLRLIYLFFEPMILHWRYQKIRRKLYDEDF